MPPPPSVDIFCRVVDNYGDIGVCWRLARQLAARPDCGTVRLWVDDLASFARIAPSVAPEAAAQILRGVIIQRWKTGLDAAAPPPWTAAASPDTPRPSGAPVHPAPGPQPADIVIEAFACSPPPGYIERMSSRQLWINLEYLSAEAWVESCHGLPSLQSSGLRKFFFFPGFTPGTGGLPREPGLIDRRDAWQAEPQARLALLRDLGVDAAWLERLRAGAALVYVYCYPQAPLPALMRALGRQKHDTLVLLPRGIWPHALQGRDGNGYRVEAHAHEFVDQDTFDRLLWSSDLNVVRGEDSLVRALWAGRAMMWQPYPQQHDAHLDKLEAWLARSPYPDDIRRAMRAWNRGDADSAAMALEPLLEPARIKRWAGQTRSWCAGLAQDDDLASRLLGFYAKNH